MALTPTRPQFGFASGSNAKRAGICLLPICRFHASVPVTVERPRPALKPTPSNVLRGGSTIIVVIRLPPHAKIPPGDSIPGNQVDLSSEGSRCQYEGTDCEETAE